MSIHLKRIECKVYRAPVSVPVQTSFGIMHDRPAVLVHIIDKDGAEGWGEMWCNFPSVGAEHRARLLRDVVAPAALNRSFGAPTELFEHLRRHFHVLAIQTGEHGPLAQVIAGIDIAAWDLAARRQGISVQALLGAAQKQTIPAYASGLNPDQPDVLAARMYDAGHRAFKLKIGFGDALDIENLTKLRRTLGDDVRLMVDVNQGWELAQAKQMVAKFAAFHLGWLEEPIAADRPLEEWQQLAAASPVPLAAGENMRDGDFAAALDGNYLGVLQPDIGKWGGFSRCLKVGQLALAGNVRFCPHWLGGGIGLLASANLLAALGGDGMVEMDVNPNPLREKMLDTPLTIEEGQLVLPQGQGLGARPDLDAISRFEVDF